MKYMYVRKHLDISATWYEVNVCKKAFTYFYYLIWSICMKESIYIFLLPDMKYMYVRKHLYISATWYEVPGGPKKMQRLFILFILASCSFPYPHTSLASIYLVVFYGIMYISVMEFQLIPQTKISFRRCPFSLVRKLTSNRFQLHFILSCRLTY